MQRPRTTKKSSKSPESAVSLSKKIWRRWCLTVDIKKANFSPKRTCSCPAPIALCFFSTQHVIEHKKILRGRSALSPTDNISGTSQSRTVHSVKYGGSSSHRHHQRKNKNLCEPYVHMLSRHLSVSIDTGPICCYIPRV